MYRVRGVSGVRRGLGDLVSDCAALSWYSYAFNPQCWAYSIPQWQQRDQLPRPPAPVPPPAPTGPALTVPPADAQQAAGTINDVLAQQMAATQAQNQQFFDTYPMNVLEDPSNPGGGGLSITTLIGLGLAAGVGILLLSSSGRRRR
jgi:hypothetical protein